MNEHKLTNLFVSVPESMPKHKHPTSIYHNYTKQNTIFSSTMEIERPVIALHYFRRARNEQSISERAYGERAMIVWSEVGGGEGWRASSAVRTSRFDEFRRNGRREVGNFAAQERNYGSTDKTVARNRAAPPIWTERRGLLSFRRVVDDMRLPPTACREDLIKALIGKWRDLIGPPPPLREKLRR